MEKSITVRELLDMIERAKKGSENMGTRERAAHIVAYLSGAFDVRFPEIGLALAEVLGIGPTSEKEDV